LKGRPLVLRRRPEGLKGQLFYQKDAGNYAADWMETAAIDGVRFFVVNDTAGLLYLTNLGCIDHNPWASRVDDLEHPDYIFIDLDPTEGTPFTTVVDVAREIHKVLAAAGLKAYLKTSGATGFHIFVPLERVYDFKQAGTFTEIVMRLAAAKVPDKVTFERKVERRPRGRVLMDYSQLSYSRPLASVYSVRPEPAANVSSPVTADELRSSLRPEQFTILTLPERLKKVGDLWADFWDSRQRLEPALERLRAIT
jgi:bifunctional non-homologous end joining protein LigD